MTSLHSEQTKITSRALTSVTRAPSDKIAASITAFELTNSVLIDARNTIIAEYGRIEVARCLKRSKTPAIRLEHLSETELHAYALATIVWPKLPVGMKKFW